jgi:hypothetical protein
MEADFHAAKLALLEPAAMFLFIMGYIWIWRASHPYLWIAILACLLLSHVLHRESARELGFGRASLSECAHRFAPLLTVLALAMLAGGLLLNTTRRMPADQAFLALFAYLPWGVLQQYMLNGYFLNRFDRALSSARIGLAHGRAVRRGAYAQLVPHGRRIGGRMVRHASLPAASQPVFPGNRPRHHRIPALRHRARFHQPSPEYRAGTTPPSPAHHAIQ